MITSFMLSDRHKNEGTTLLSKIIFDCATKSGIECVVKDISLAHIVQFYRIRSRNMCQLHRYYSRYYSQNCTLFCTAYLDDAKLTIDFGPISLSTCLDSGIINPKFWHVLVRPDSLVSKYEVDINDPKALDELVELFAALRPIGRL